MQEVLQHIEKIVGKENLENFYKKLKENLTKIPKENEKKEFSFKIKGTSEEPAGFGINIETISKNEYPKYISEEKDYMKKALTVISFSLNLKDAEQAGTIEQLFNQFKPMIDELPFVKEYLDNKTLEYFLRVEGTKLNIDLTLNNEAALEHLKDIGVDFADYQKLQFLLRTNLKGNGIFDSTLEKLCEDIASLIFKIEGSTFNAKFLIKALLATLESMEIKEDRQKRKLEKLKMILAGILCFEGACFNFNFDAKTLTNCLLANPVVAPIKDTVNEGLDQGKGMAESFGGEASKGLLEGFGMYEPAKAIVIDEINISLLSPEYKNGLVFTIYLPGITEFINQKFLSA